MAALEGAKAQQFTPFLATVRPDGRPHGAGVGAVWQDDKVYFVSGPGTRKSRNLAENPDCSVAFALPGIDLVVEGRAKRVTDAGTLSRLAGRYAEEGWPTRTTSARRAPGRHRGTCTNWSRSPSSAS